MYFENALKCDTLFMRLKKDPLSLELCEVVNMSFMYALYIIACSHSNSLFFLRFCIVLRELKDKTNFNICSGEDNTLIHYKNNVYRNRLAHMNKIIIDG